MVDPSLRQSGYVFLVSCLIKLLTLNKTLYFSTDFEVHRNWLAITHSLPFRQWYTEATSKWTLDYPPFFAYFEWFLSQFARLVDPIMLDVKRLEYASFATIAFQRLTVILISDFWLGVGVYMILPPKRRARGLILALFSSTLIMVDHIHFQYNGMLLGLLLIAAALMQSGRFYAGAATYMTLVFFKHIYLYSAPVVFVFCLKKFVLATTSPRDKIARLFRLAAVVLGVTAVAILPLVMSGQLNAAMARLFPFGRGLVHDYMASNMWTLYMLLDKAVGQFLRIGLNADINALRVLPSVTPTGTAVVTLLAYIPLLLSLWRNKGPKASQLIFYIGIGNFLSFWCGFHVHEKAILMVLVPLLMSRLIGGGDATYEWGLSVVSYFTVIPLLPPGPVMWALGAVGVLLDALLLNVQLASTPKWLVLVTLIPVINYTFRSTTHRLWLARLPRVTTLLFSLWGCILLPWVLYKIVKSHSADRPKKM